MKNLLSGGRLALLLLCFAGFALYGMYYNSFGANAEVTMAYLGIDEVRNGAIMSVQSVGCLAVAVFLGLFGERLNKILALAVGLGLLGAAGLCIGLMPWLAGGSYALMLGFSLVAGLGFISIDLLTNSVVADVFQGNKNRVLPYVHAFYGGGAMLAPVFVTALVSPERPALAVTGVRIRGGTPYADMSEIRRRARQNPAEIFKESRAWLFLLSGFMNLAFQTGLTTWLPRYCSEVRDIGFTASGLIVTAYFTGALVMRLLSPLAYAKLGVRRFYRGSLLTSAVLYVLFLLLPMPYWAAAGVVGVMGLLQGATVPTLVIICCDAFPERTASASSIIVFGVSLASLVSPVLMGRIMQDSPQAAMLSITACTVIAALSLPRSK